MNVVYRVVWNSTTNTWVVASEMAKGRKKKAEQADKTETSGKPRKKPAKKAAKFTAAE